MSDQIFFIYNFCFVFSEELLVVTLFVIVFLCVVNIDTSRQSSIAVYGINVIDILIIQCGCIVLRMYYLLYLGSLDWIKVCKASSKVMYQLYVY